MGARTWAALLTMALAVGCASGDDDDDSGPSTVTVSGDAQSYPFGSSLQGTVATLPTLSGVDPAAVVNDSFELDVPANSTFRLQFDSADHVTTLTRTLNVGTSAYEIYPPVVQDAFVTTVDVFLSTTWDTTKGMLLVHVRDDTNGVGLAGATVSYGSNTVTYLAGGVSPDVSMTETDAEGGAMFYNANAVAANLNVTPPVGYTCATDGDDSTSLPVSVTVVSDTATFVAISCTL